MQGTGETPLTWEKNLSPSSLSSGNLEGLTEKVGIIGLHSIRKNRRGAGKRRARKARLAEAPTGDTASGQPQPSRGSRPQTCRVERDMASTISFFQVNLQQNIADSRILTRTISSKGTDMALI